MENGLEKVAQQIEEEGLPSTREMRDVINQERSQEFQDGVHAKIFEYKTLFERFRSGQQLTSEEIVRMTDLSDELRKLSGN